MMCLCGNCERRRMTWRKRISREELSRLSFTNSPKLPQVVEIDGRRMEWVGIGWIGVGAPTGREVLVVD